MCIFSIHPMQSQVKKSGCHYCVNRLSNIVHLRNLKPPISIVSLGLVGPTFAKLGGWVIWNII